MISDSVAKRIMENPDSCDFLDIADFILWASEDDRELSRGEAAVTSYCLFSLIGCLFRLRGMANKSIEFEVLAEKFYKQMIPEERKW